MMVTAAKLREGTVTVTEVLAGVEGTLVRAECDLSNGIVAAVESLVLERDMLAKTHQVKGPESARCPKCNAPWRAYSFSRNNFAGVCHNDHPVMTAYLDDA